MIYVIKKLLLFPNSSKEFKILLSLDTGTKEL